MELTSAALHRGLAGDWRKRLREWPLPLPRFELELNKTALLIVDMQYGSVDPEHGVGPYLHSHHPAVAEYYYGQVTQRVVPNIQRLWALLPPAARPVVYPTTGSAR